MQPWPIEELALRPVLSVLLCGSLPFATDRVLRALLSDDLRSLRTARDLVGLTNLALACAIGMSALAPPLSSSRFGPASLLIASLCALTSTLADAAARRLHEPASARPSLRAALVSRLAWVVPRVARRDLAGGALRGGDAGARGMLVRDRLGWPPTRAGLAVGALLATLLTAGAMGLERGTRIEGDQVEAASESAARWRLRIDPHDATAMLASGWSARRRRAHQQALRWAEAARVAGAPRPSTLELEAEVAAARGDCEDARATFDRALRARTEALFADPLAQPLALGGFRVPPTLATRCGGAERPDPVSVDAR